VKVTAAFVTSAAGAVGFPRDPLPRIALVGRSNVGKSSLINRLAGSRIARTSGTPGKTRLANFYRVEGTKSEPFYLVDLPGYGYARAERHGAQGRAEAAKAFEALARDVFGQAGQVRQEGRDGPPQALPAPVSAWLLVDTRHPGLDSDLDAWRWMQTVVTGPVAIVATKIDKLARGERIRALRQLESVFEHPVVPCSAATGEGMEELWKLIDRQQNSPEPQPDRPRPQQPPKATAPRHRKSSSGSTSRHSKI
jgi:GTP-binding protein